MHTGLQIPHFRPATPATMRRSLKDIVQTAEANGFYSIWVMDHFFQLGGWLGEPETDMLEGYTTLGYFAGLTERVRLGLMVGGVIYRHPGIVIKTVSTLDVLSDGRMYFGIGAGWYEHESKSLGLPFPTMKARFEQLEDILQLAHQMWKGDTSEFSGRQFTLPYPVNNPQPLQKPHPPILIGGMGKKKTLRYVAQYADATNLFGGAGIAALRERIDILKGHCDDVGRDYAEIEKTVLDTFTPAEQSMSDLVARARELRDLGFSHVIFNIRGEYTPEIIEQLGREALPEIAEL